MPFCFLNSPKIILQNGKNSKVKYEKKAFVKKPWPDSLLIVFTVGSQFGNHDHFCHTHQSLNAFEEFVIVACSLVKWSLELFNPVAIFKWTTPVKNDELCNRVGVFSVCWCRHRMWCPLSVPLWGPCAHFAQTAAGWTWAGWPPPCWGGRRGWAPGTSTGGRRRWS